MLMDWLHKRLKLSVPKHTGRRLPHHATSHGILIVLLVAVGITMLAASRIVLASAASSSGSVELSGAVYTPAPARAAVIEDPVNNQRFIRPRVTVSGNCPDNSFVQIYKNKIFAGSAQCLNGRFSLQIDLVGGRNELVAKVFDNLGQFGPYSAAVVVFYDVPASSPKNKQLLVSTDSIYKGVSAGQKLDLTITVLGGRQPYAVLIKWGDGTQELIARSAEGEFSLNHVYKQGGIYNIDIEVTDQSKQKASLQLVILVNGTPKPAAVTTVSSPPSHVPVQLAIIWPIYLIIVAIITTFWLGERYELYKLKHDGRLKKA